MVNVYLLYSPNRNRLHRKSQLDIAHTYPVQEMHLRDILHRNRSQLSFLFGPRHAPKGIPGNLSHRCRTNLLDSLDLQKNQGNIVRRCLRRLAPSLYNKDLVNHRQSIRLRERESRSILYKVYSLFDLDFLGNILGDSCCTTVARHLQIQRKFQGYIRYILTILQSVDSSQRGSLRK